MSLLAWVMPIPDYSLERVKALAKPLIFIISENWHKYAERKERDKWRVRKKKKRRKEEGEKPPFLILSNRPESVERIRSYCNASGGYWKLFRLRVRKTHNSSLFVLFVSYRFFRVSLCLNSLILCLYSASIFPSSYRSQIKSRSSLFISIQHTIPSLMFPCG